MSGTADYLDMNFGPKPNRVANAELLDKAGELISAFLKAQGLSASPRIFCREKASAPPLLIIVTPRDGAPYALDALEKSNACHPQYPFMDFKSVAVAVRDESGEEGLLFNAGQPVIHQIACALEQRPA
jgi:hypothetical protein